MRPQTSARLLYLLFGLSLPLSVNAEIIELPTQTITARAPPADDTPETSRTRITRKDINASKKTDLNGLLRGQNGVQLFQASASTSTGITLGGASGGLGLVTLDGIPLFANVTGSYSLQHLLADFIDHIDIQRGGSGQLSASRTLGGAIHLNSRELSEESYAKFEAGNYGTFREGAGTGWKTPLGNWTALGQRLDITDGLTQASRENGNRERDDYQLWNGLLRGRKTFARGEVDTTLMYSRGREDLDGPGRLPNGTYGWKDALQGLAYNQTWLAQGRIRQQLSSRWESSLQLGLTRNRQDVHVPIVPYFNSSNLWLLRWQNQHGLIKPETAKDLALNINWGLDLQQQHGTANSRFAYKATTLNSSSVFLQSQADWQDWMLNAETRLEDHQSFGSKALFSAKLTRKIGDTLQVWLAGGSGYRPPAVNERLNPLFGNRKLKAEAVTSAEAGAQWQVSPDTSMKINFSHRNVSQLIVLQFDSKTGSTRSANIAQADIWLLENELKHRWNNAFETGLTYTYMDAHNPLNGRQIPLRAAHQGNLWQTWQVSPQVQLRVELNVRDSFWFDKANTVKNTPAPRLNLAANYQPGPHLELYLRCDNVNNERSPETNNFSYPGITFFGGFKTRF